MSPRDARGRFIAAKGRQRLSASQSSVMTVFIPPETRRKMMDFFNNAAQRVQDGQRYVCLEATKIILDKIQSLAPAINGFDYAKKLEIGDVGHVGDQYVVAILFSQEEERRYRATVLEFVDAKEGEPADLKDAAGKPVEKGEAHALGKDVLRVEYGVGTRGQLRDEKGRYLPKSPDHRAHWRPAIQHLKQRVADLQRKFVRYVETGKASIWDLPECRPMTVTELQSGKWFQDKIQVAL